MERLGDELLAAAGSVDVRGVDQVDAELEGTAQDARGLVGIVDDPHCAEAEPAHLELATEQERRAHAEIIGAGFGAAGVSGAETSG